MIWMDQYMQWYTPASGRRGRQHIFSDATIQFCLSFKCLFGLALRQNLGLVESLLRMAGLDWKVPDFSSVSPRQMTQRVQLPYRASTTALDLLMDRTGTKFLGEDEWKRKKHGAEYRRQWRKMHLGIDANTLEIRAIKVTDNVTLGQFKQFIAASGRIYLMNEKVFMKYNGFGDNAPVTMMSWNDAQDFVAWLNQTDGKGWRLPSEA